MKDSNGYVTVTNRSDFYKDSSRRLLLTMIISMIANAVLAVAAFIFIVFPPPAQFIVAYPDGRLVPIQPLTEAVKSTPQIIAFASNAVATINSFDFVNFRSQLQAAANFFTYSGWDNFRQQLAASRNVDYVRENRLVVTATPSGVPVIENQRVLNGHYTWQVTVPILIQYAGPTVSKTVSQVVTMMIQRAPFTETPNGIGITQYIVRG